MISPNEEIVLNRVASIVHGLARAKGWHDDHDSAGVFLARACNNLHAEVSELWESYRNNSFAKLCDKWKQMDELGIQPLTCAEEELADIVIRVFDDAERLGINIGSAIARKHAFNAHREYRHGGKIA